MQFTRHVLTFLSYVIGLWILASVAGAYLDPANAEFWSASLMWSFLSSLLVAPALVLMYDASTRVSDESRANQPHAAQRQPPASTPPSTTQKPFVEETGAAYPISKETEEQKDTEDEVWPDWVQAHSK